MAAPHRVSSPGRAAYLFLRPEMIPDQIGRALVEGEWAVGHEVTEELRCFRQAFFRMRGGVSEDVVQLVGDHPSEGQAEGLLARQQTRARRDISQRLSDLVAFHFRVRQDVAA